MFAGSTASTGFWIGDVEEGAWGQAAVSDRENLFQQLYLGFTAPRKDPAAFEAWKIGQKTVLSKRDLKPETVFSDEIQRALTKGHPRRQPVVAANIDEVNLDRAVDIFKDRFGDVSDFTFIIVGSFEPPALRWYVETYLASLPAKGRIEQRIDVGIRNPTGLLEKRIARGSEPKAVVSITFHGEQAWTADDERDVEILAGVLRTRLREILREELGGVYGVSVVGGFTRSPRQVRTMAIRFGCSPANVAPLRKAVFDEIERMKHHGVAQSYVDKIKAARQRRFETERMQNRWWQTELEDAYDFGDDPREIQSIDAVVARMTTARVLAAARRYLDTHQYLIAVLEPTPAPRTTP
jgi:zinc protease